MVLGDELQFVSVDNREIGRILVLSSRLKHLLFAKVADDRSLGASGPASNRCGQLDYVVFLVGRRPMA